MAAVTPGVPYFPVIVPPSTVIGRLASGAGPAEAIPFSMLGTLLGAATYLIAASISGVNTVTGLTVSGAQVALPLSANQIVEFVPASTNTAAATFNRDGLGAVQVLSNGAALVGGELIAGIPVALFYDGANYRIVGGGFIQSGTGAVAEDLQSRGRWFVLATDRMSATQRADVVSNGGAVDVLTALQTAITDAVANRLTLIFPAGTYTISGKLELGFAKLKVIALGHVIIKHTGTGVAVSFDAGSGSTNISDINFGWGNQFYLQGNASTTNLIFVRGCHHMRVEANVRDGTTALNIAFSVSSQFKLTSSVNEGAFVTRPTNMLSTTRRGAGESLSNCEFWLIAEGSSSYGVTLDYCNASTFHGTSEGNLAGGVNITANCSHNIFINVDVESNGSTNADWTVAGDRNLFFNCISFGSTSNPATNITGKRNKFIGGQLSTVTVASGADYNVLDGVGITSTLTTTSLLTTVINCVDVNGNPIADQWPEVAWTTYTPTITAGTGSITTSSASGRYKANGKTVFFEADITITNNGTGGSTLNFTLPFTAVARGGFSGTEYASSGHAVCGDVAASGSTVTLRKYDATYPAATGNKFLVTGVFEKS